MPYLLTKLTVHVRGLIRGANRILELARRGYEAPRYAAPMTRSWLATGRRRLRRVATSLAAWIGLASFVPACSSEATEVAEEARGGHTMAKREHSDPKSKLIEALEIFAPDEPNSELAADELGVEVIDNPWNRTYRCEDFEVHVGDKGRLRHKRLRHEWTRADRDRFKHLVEMVAQEMGADPRLLRLWSLRESTYNPYAIHVLNPDLEAADRSWERHRYTDAKAARLEEEMERVGAKHPRFWEAKAELGRMERFRNNRFFDAAVEYDLVYADGTRARDAASRWSYGYGPFGFNPTYFLPVWDVEAPPWVFCEGDGIPAIVTAIWSARNHQRECRSLGYDESYATVNRRFSSGSCNPRPTRAHRFRQRAESWGIDPDAKARLGTKWPQEGTDRVELYERLRTRAEAKGLLSERARASAMN